MRGPISLVSTPPLPNRRLSGARPLPGQATHGANRKPRLRSNGPSSSRPSTRRGGSRPISKRSSASSRGAESPARCVVVDDSSTDGTADTVRAVTARCPAVRALVLGPRNFGKGGAVRAGMLSARGRFRLFTDADGATPIAELKRLEPALMAGADVVIGSRGAARPLGLDPQPSASCASRSRVQPAGGQRRARTASPTRSAASRPSRPRPHRRCSARSGPRASASTSRSSCAPALPATAWWRWP